MKQFSKIVTEQNNLSEFTYTVSREFHIEFECFYRDDNKLFQLHSTEYYDYIEQNTLNGTFELTINILSEKLRRNIGLISIVIIPSDRIFEIKSLKILNNSSVMTIKSDNYQQIIKGVLKRCGLDSVCHCTKTNMLSQIKDSTEIVNKL